MSFWVGRVRYAFSGPPRVCGSAGKVVSHPTKVWVAAQGKLLVNGIGPIQHAPLRSEPLLIIFNYSKELEKDSTPKLNRQTWEKNAQDRDHWYYIGPYSLSTCSPRFRRVYFLRKLERVTCDCDEFPLLERMPRRAAQCQKLCMPCANSTQRHCSSQYFLQLVGGLVTASAETKGRYGVRHHYSWISWSFFTASRTAKISIQVQEGPTYQSKARISANGYT